MTEPNGENVAPLPAPGRSWLRPLVFGTTLLISGAVIGSALTMLVLRSQAERARDDPAGLSQRTAVRLIHDLDLTPEQGEQVREIFHAHHERARTFREEHRSVARELFAELQAEIEEVLTPDQAERWRRRIERARERAMREGSWRDRGDPRMEGPRDRGRHPDDRYRRERPDGMRPHERFPRPEGRPPPEGMPSPPPPEDMPPPPFPGGTPPHENPPPGNV